MGYSKKRHGGSGGGHFDKHGSGGRGDRDFGGGRGGGGRFGGGGGGFRGPRTMHKAVCSDCGKECDVPFEPTEGRPVYCRDCFQKHKKF